MKKIIKIFSISLISILLSIVAVFALAKNNPEFKKDIYAIGKIVKDEIYREATLNNPEGDVVPDEWDDAIMKEIEKQM